jgi:hypothetical protein
MTIEPSGRELIVPSRGSLLSGEKGAVWNTGRVASRQKSLRASTSTIAVEIKISLFFAPAIMQPAVKTPITDRNVSQCSFPARDVALVRLHDRQNQK